MLAAGLTANLTKVEDSLGVVNVLGGGVPLTQSIGGYQLAMGLGTAAALVLIFGLLFLAGTKIKPGTNSQGDQPLAASFVQVKPALAGEEKTSSLFVTLDKLKEVGSWHLALLGLAVEFVAGFAFAIGLGIGGMTQNSKVVGFLSVAFTW